MGLADAEILDWLTLLADHVRRSVEEGRVPAPAKPDTHWEWHARFPELGQFLGGWCSQDMPDEAVGAAELGMEVEAPDQLSVSGRLALVAARLA